MKHIMIVCMHFHPVQFRINDIALELIQRNYKVTVVTGIPNYPDAKFTKGYGWFKKRKENYKGIDIIRIPIFARGTRSISLILNYLSFNFFGYFFAKFTKVKADHVFIYGTSPLLKAMVGLRYAKRRKIESTLYVMDLWPESVQYAGGINHPFVLKYLTKRMIQIYNMSTHILTSSISFIDSIKKLDISSQKLEYWPQSAEELFTKPTDENRQTEIIRDHRCNIIFTGTIAVAQGLSILPEVAIILKEMSYPVRFVIVGDGREREHLAKTIEQYDVKDYFQLIDRKPVSDIPYYFRDSDCALLTLIDSPIFELTIPAKLQSYMAFGIPIIASAKGEVKRIINEAHCGFTSEPENEKELANIIIEFLKLSSEEKNIMAKHAKNYSKSNFDRTSLMDRLEEIMNIKENHNV